MAKASTKKAAPAKKKTAAASTTKTEQPSGTAVIKIDKDKHGGTVRGAVNGERYEFPTDSDVTVTAAQLNSLSDSHVDFSIVTPLAGEDAAEGSAASSTAERTATRLEAPKSATDEDGEPKADHELSQITDKELTENSQEASRDQAESGEAKDKSKS